MKLALAALLAAAPAAAAPPTAAAVLMAGLEGAWEGTLGYRDYQSGKIETIPMAREVEALRDGATIITRSRFSDPGRTVFITGLTLIEGARVRATSFRVGSDPELATERVTVTADATPLRWTLVFTGVGRDDDRPANLRQTVRRDGDTLVETKEVDFTDDAVVAWTFRNETRLKRVATRW